MRCRAGLLLLGFLFSTAALAQTAPARESLDEESAQYARTESTGAVAALQKRLADGQATLPFERQHGYLPALLRELHVPVSSQVLVASKTSPNRHFISPKNPRALYFNERSAIAYVPGAPIIEVTDADPKLGIVFYTMEQKEAPAPHLTRDNRCLECHSSSRTLDVPGLLVRSFRTDDQGEVDLLSGIMVTHRTPLSQRWGGYYVTGTLGNQAHLGNWFPAESGAGASASAAANRNVVDLKGFLDTGKYPEPGSDVVALLVLDHQVQMQNLLTRLTHEAESASRRGDDLRPVYPAVEAVLKYMLFTDEATLTAPIQGTSSFAKDFEAGGRKDPQGRSLRQLDLQSRLFKFPCSYMIESPAFEAVPADAKKRVWHRLWEVLSGEDKSPEFQRIPDDTKRAIREILTATHPGIPAYWRL